MVNRGCGDFSGMIGLWKRVGDKLLTRKVKGEYFVDD